MKKESRLLLHLEEFNRKERFFLVGMALGNPEFRLGEEFRERLAQKLSLQVPRDAFVAMDYHLDWLAASLFLAANEGNPGPYKRDKNIISEPGLSMLIGSAADSRTEVLSTTKSDGF